MGSITTAINAIVTAIKPIAIPLAGLLLMVVGILWMTAKDPQKKEQYQGWLLNIGIGLVIIYTAVSVVTWFTNLL